MKSNHVDEYVSSGTSPTARLKVPKKSEMVAFRQVPIDPSQMITPFASHILIGHDATQGTFSDARLLEPFQKYMLRTLLFHAGKTIMHRGGICEVVETHNQVRQLMPLINKDLNEANPQLFWVPLRPASRKQMRQERVRRQYTSGLRVAFSGLHYTGQARPIAESVPLESIYSEMPQETIKFLRSLGSPESRLPFSSSRMTRMMSVFIRSANLKLWLHQQLNKKTKELMETLVVEHLRRSQMSDSHVNATYAVLVGGTALAAAAKQRGLDESHLRQVVNRVTRRLRPAVEAQLTAWAGDEEIQRAVDEVGVLDAQKAAMIDLIPDELKRERITSIR
jgi:hypothetical protein